MKTEKENSVEKEELVEEKNSENNGIQRNSYAGAGDSGSSDASSGDGDNFTQNPYLPERLQRKAQKTLGEDFSNVNIYKNSPKAKQLGAKAFTQGNNIHFASGKYNPYSKEGQKLIAHELVHVAQQRRGEYSPVGAISTPLGKVWQDDIMESQATSFAENMEPAFNTERNTALPLNFGSIIQMDPEILDDIKYSITREGDRLISLRIDADGDQVFDLFCEIKLLKETKKGFVKLEKLNGASAEEPMILEFELKGQTPNSWSDFYVSHQVPNSSLGPYELHLLNDILIVKIDNNEVRLLSEIEIMSSFEQKNTQKVKPGFEYLHQHKLTTGETDNNVFLSDRLFFKLHPFNDRIAIHFLQEKSEINDGQNKTSLIPKIAVFGNNNEGIQLSLDPVELNISGLDGITDYSFETVEVDRHFNQYKITFSGEGGIDEVFFTMYTRPIGDYAKGDNRKFAYADLAEQRKIIVEFSPLPFRNSSDSNKKEILVKGIPNTIGYQIPIGKTNLRLASHFIEAASIDAEGYFRKPINFENLDEKRQLDYYSQIAQSIKNMHEFVPASDMENLAYYQTVSSFFKAWDTVKKQKLNNEEVTDNQENDLRSSWRAYWDQLITEGFKKIEGDDSHYASTGRSILSAYQFESPTFIDQLLDSESNYLEIFNAEIELAYTLLKWYRKNGILEKYAADTNLPDLGVLLNVIEFENEKRLDVEKIKEGSKSPDKLSPVSGSYRTNFYMARTVFYPHRQRSSENISGIPVDLYIYRETTVDIFNNFISKWKIRTWGLNDQLHLESLVTDQLSLEECHEELMLTLDDSNFSPAGHLFYQLIPEDGKGKTIHGNVQLKGTDDNHGIFGSYDGIASLALAGVNIISAFTPAGPVVFAITSAINLVNTIAKAWHNGLEGHYTGRDTALIAIDLAAALFDVSGAARMGKSAFFETVGVTVNGSKMKYLKMMGPQWAGISADLGAGLLMTVDVYTELKKMNELEDMSSWEKAMTLIFMMSQGGLFFASGSSRVKDVLKYNKYSKLNKEFFSPGSTKNVSLPQGTPNKKLMGTDAEGNEINIAKRYAMDNPGKSWENDKGLSTYLSKHKLSVPKKDLKVQRKRIEVYNAIQGFEKQHGSWLKNRKEFDKYVRKKNISINRKLLAEIETRQKFFIIHGNQIYGETKFRELTDYMTAKNLSIHELEDFLKSNRVNAGLSTHEIAFIHKGFDGDESLMKEFLDDYAMRNNPDLVKAIIQVDQNTINPFKLFKEDKVAFYQFGFLKQLEFLEDSNLKKWIQLSAEKKGIKTKIGKMGEPNYATNGQLPTIQNKYNVLLDEQNFLKEMNQYHNINESLTESKNAVSKLKVNLEADWKLFGHKVSGKTKTREWQVLEGETAKEVNKICDEIVIIKKYLNKKNELNIAKMTLEGERYTGKGTRRTKTSKNRLSNARSRVRTIKHEMNEIKSQNKHLIFSQEQIVKRENQALNLLYKFIDNSEAYANLKKFEGELQISQANLNVIKSKYQNDASFIANQKGIDVNLNQGYRIGLVRQNEEKLKLLKQEKDHLTKVEQDFQNNKTELIRKEKERLEEINTEMETLNLENKKIEEASKSHLHWIKPEISRGANNKIRIAKNMAGQLKKMSFNNMSNYERLQQIEDTLEQADLSSERLKSIYQEILVIAAELYN